MALQARNIIATHHSIKMCFQALYLLVLADGTYVNILYNICTQSASLGWAVTAWNRCSMQWKSPQRLPTPGISHSSKLYPIPNKINAIQIYSLNVQKNCMKCRVDLCKNSNALRLVFVSLCSDRQCLTLHTKTHIYIYVFPPADCNIKMFYFFYILLRIQVWS